MQAGASLACACVVFRAVQLLTARLWHAPLLLLLRLPDTFPSMAESNGFCSRCPTGLEVLTGCFRRFSQLDRSVVYLRTPDA